MSLIRAHLGGEADAFRAYLREEAPPRRRPPAPRSVQEHARTLRSGARMTRAVLLEELGVSDSEAAAMGLGPRR